VLTVGRGGGVNFFALDKPTYQILASYKRPRTLQKVCVVVVVVVVESDFSVML